MTSPVDLFALVIEVDEKLIGENVLPHQRPIRAICEIADRLKMKIILAGHNKSKLVDEVHQIYNQLYRQDDLLAPPLHIGAFMFRDVFFPLHIPVIYGTTAINPITCIKNITQYQLSWLFNRIDIGISFYDQFCDLFDFTYGLDDASKIKKLPERTIELWCLAKQQLEGAAATLFGSFDKYTVIQNSFIAMELLLKGVLIANGITDAEIKKHYGHDMQKVVYEACCHLPKANEALLQLVVNRMPPLVERRYQTKQYSRVELGCMLMDTQFVAGEILRQFSDRDLRVGLRSDPTSFDISKRVYPN